MTPKVVELQKTMMTKAKRKRLVQGRDFDGWAWQYLDKKENKRFLGYAYRRKPILGLEGDGEWVRVKFVEVGD